MVQFYMKSDKLKRERSEVADIETTVCKAREANRLQCTLGHEG